MVIACGPRVVQKCVGKLKNHWEQGMHLQGMYVSPFKLSAFVGVCVS